MLKRRVFELVVVAFSAAYLTAMTFVFSSSEQPTKDTNNQSYQNRTYERCKDKQWECLWHWMTTDAAGFFTFCLVIVGGVQFVMFLVQLRYISDSLTIAKIAAGAAKRSADSDRPHMLPVQFKISGMRGPVGDDGQTKSICEFQFVNYGRSPAFMKTFCFQDHIGHELPPIPHYGESIKLNHIIAVNGWLGSVEGDVSKPIEISMPASDAADILVGRNNYFIFGYIEYDDVASQNHKMRFAYSFDWGQGDMSERFRPAGPDTYREYT